MIEKTQFLNRLSQSHHNFQFQSLLRQLQFVFRNRHYCRIKFQVTKKESKKKSFDKNKFTNKSVKIFNENKSAEKSIKKFFKKKICIKNVNIIHILIYVFLRMTKKNNEIVVL